jgi:chromate transporter
MVLHGPEAQQLAIYVGWKLHGKRGGVVAGTLFVLLQKFKLNLICLLLLSVGFGLLRCVTGL